MKQSTRLFIMMLVITISACSSTSTNSAKDSNLTGADKDVYGCIGSAGYSWCERTQQCERPWELAEQQGFKNSSEAFVTFCSQ